MQAAHLVVPGQHGCDGCDDESCCPNCQHESCTNCDQGGQPKGDERRICLDHEIGLDRLSGEGSVFCNRAVST